MPSPSLPPSPTPQPPMADGAVPSIRQPVRGWMWIGPLLLAVLLLGSGCAVGLQFPDGPEPLADAEAGPFNAPPVYVVTCALTGHTPPGPWVDRFAEVMQRDYGVAVFQGKPEGGEAHVRLRMTLGRPRMASGLAFASAAISTATASIIPGYFGEEYPVAFAYTVRVPGLAAPVREVRYRYGYSYVLWLPFIVYPDFIAGITGGYENPETKFGAWDLVTRRFAEDLRAAVGNPAGAPGEPYAGPLESPCPESEG